MPEAMPGAMVLSAALAAYALVGALALPATGAGVQPAAGRVQRYAGFALATALALHTLALGLRWSALGHGPFTTMHEILSSSLWSLALIFALAWWRVAELRAALPVVLPVWAVLAAWLLMADARAGHLPPTYATPLLYLHAVVGKLYLGLLLVAAVVGLVPALRRTAWGVRRFAKGVDDRRLDELAHRFAAYALVADTLMLIVGAVWAQDAWGRYWAWDPLESWAFASWLALVAALHARATLRPPPAHFGLWLAGSFALAFLTFFGVPFISTAPHKGAI
ncbi:MAG: cytochrome c biogenesis protein [Piscinibacter sp.]|uniref:cytochrome c biogenesis protein n=1 Tax=Piscinibacter sp. TaxID=1903157 RepID=UPI003D0F5058